MSKEYTAEQQMRGMDLVLQGKACVICLQSPLPKGHDSKTCEMAE
jgi:hypothetical protein